MKTYELNEQTSGGWTVTRKDEKQKPIGVSAHSNRKNAINKVLAEIAGTKKICITVQGK